MTYIVMSLALIGAVTLQVLWPSAAAPAGARPPWVAAVVLYYVLNRRFEAALVAAAAGGIAGDMFSDAPLGASAALLWGLVFAARPLRSFVVADSHVTAAVFGAVTGALLPVGLWPFLIRSGAGAWALPSVAVRCLAAGLWGAVAAPGVFFALRRLDRAVGIEESRESGHENA